MPVSKAAFQHFVDWCTKPDPAGIFVRNIGAILHLLPKDPLDFGEIFQGTLRYLPSGLTSPARFQGAMHANIYPDWTLEIKLNDPFVQVLIVSPDGIVLQTDQINPGNNAGAPSHMNLAFQDDQTRAYTLDLWDQVGINWNALRRRNIALAAHG